VTLLQLNADEVFVIERLRRVQHDNAGHGYGVLRVVVENGQLIRTEREHKELTPSMLAAQARARKTP
jgi:hypothetical protein